MKDAKAKRIEKNFNVVAFVGGVKQELKKISWTSSEELKVYTKITLIATLAMGVAIYFSDLVLRSALLGFEWLVKLFAG